MGRLVGDGVRGWGVTVSPLGAAGAQEASVSSDTWVLVPQTPVSYSPWKKTASCTRSSWRFSVTK